MQFSEMTGEALSIELNNSDVQTLYTTARRQTAINAGLLEFADRTKCYVRRSTITVTHDVAEYPLVISSTDYVELAKQGLPEYRLTSSGGQVTILAGEDFPLRQELWNNRYRSGWRSSTTPGIPTSYYLRPDGGSLVLGLDLRPKVGSSQAAALVVPYVARPRTPTASTDVPFTDATGATRSDLTVYHQAAVHYAAWKLLPLVGDVEGAKGQFALFLDYVDRYTAAQRPKGGSHVTLVTYLGMARRDRDDADRVPVTQWT